MTTGSRAAGAPNWSTLDLAEGFHLACALLAIDRSGILASLNRFVDAGTLADKHEVDRGMLEAALQLLAARTNLVVRKGRKYRTTGKHDVYERFVLRQYLGAYGATAVALHRSLRAPSLAPNLIDRREHSKAFGEAAALSSSMLADLIVQLALNHVLDLGCGTGIMLFDLFTRVPGFIGWGVDINPSMCAAARKHTAGARHISIFRGDCRDLERAIPAPLVAQVRTITASNLANEFFANGTTTAVAWLSDLKARFPGRTLLIADYYGSLGTRREPWSQHLALHDFVQVISGQGVPPTNLNGWKKIYRAARCILIHAFEDRNATLFVHILKL